METTELVSTANDGSNSGVLGAIDISSDGRYVAFTGKNLDGSTGYIDAYVPQAQQSLSLSTTMAAWAHQIKVPAAYQLAPMVAMSPSLPILQT